MGSSGGLGRVGSWWPAARPAGGAGSCRFPASAALLGPPAAGISGAGGLPDQRSGSGGAAGDAPSGPGRRRRAPRAAAGTTAGTASGGTLDVAASGPGSDSLLVMTGSGGCQLVAGGPASCSPYPDSLYPAVQVTGSGGVLAVFRPGTGTGITVQGPGAALPVDLTAARAGASVTLNGGTCSSPGAVPWDGGTGQFSGVIMFTGSVAGSAGFVTGRRRLWLPGGRGRAAPLESVRHRRSARVRSAPAQQRLRPAVLHHAVTAPGPAHLLPG